MNKREYQEKEGAEISLGFGISLVSGSDTENVRGESIVGRKGHGEKERIWIYVRYLGRGVCWAESYTT